MEKIMFVEDYKDCKINFNKVTEFFYAHAEEKDIENKSLNELKLQIDRMKKTKFKRIPVYVENYGKIIKSEITSFDESGNHIWLTDEDGGRGKHYLDDDVFIFNKRNTTLTEKIKRIDIKINLLSKQKEQIIKEMDLYIMKERV